MPTIIEIIEIDSWRNKLLEEGVGSTMARREEGEVRIVMMEIIIDMSGFNIVTMHCTLSQKQGVEGNK